MPFGKPLPEGARILQHELVYGAGIEPPVERLGLGPKDPDIWEVLPAFPLEFGIGTLPLPRKVMRDIAKS